MTDNAYPDGPLTPEQEDAARFGRELFERLACKAGVQENLPYTATVFGDTVIVTRLLRGSGRIYVAPDHTVLYAGSGVTADEALDVFLAGRRTPIEKFGPPAEA